MGRVDSSYTSSSLNKGSGLILDNFQGDTKGYGAVKVLVAPQDKDSSGIEKSEGVKVTPSSSSQKSLPLPSSSTSGSSQNTPVDGGKVAQKVAEQIKLVSGQTAASVIETSDATRKQVAEAQKVVETALGSQSARAVDTRTTSPDKTSSSGGEKKNLQSKAGDTTDHGYNLRRRKPGGGKHG